MIILEYNFILIIDTSQHYYDGDFENNVCSDYTEVIVDDTTIYTAQEWNYSILNQDWREYKVEYVIPQGSAVTSIGDYAFNRTSEVVKSITIPSSVTSLGENFTSSSNSIYFCSTTPPVAHEYAFDGLYGVSLYVPTGTISTYQNATNYPSSFDSTYVEWNPSREMPHTLNGALELLGETLANNITSKGVSASASDGLTTLAGKILQITGGGGSTTLYYDPCTDNTKLGNYTTIIRGEGGNCTTTWVEYDSTENAMKLTNCDNKTKSLQISALDGLNNFTLEADFKLGGSSSQSFECGFAITNSTTALCGIMLQRTSNFTTFNYHNQGGDGETNATTHSDFIGEWTHLKVTVEDLDITVEVTNVNEVTKSFTKSLSSSYYTANSMQFGICLASDYSQHSWIKNIKAESLDTPSPSSDCSQYQQQIADAIEYINGSGS